jgi:uncharacterized delta-60 repeat protein
LVINKQILFAMYKINLFLSLLLVAAFNFNTTAQNAGDNDPTFNPTDVGYGMGDGANSTVNTTVIQPDGQLIIGGSFTSYNGTNRNYIARLNTNGTLDTSFNIGTGASNIVRTIAIQPDGKIVIGGNFTTYNGTSRSRIARLNTNGTLDTSFNVGTGANNIVNTTVIQSDGKIVIGGNFTTYNGASRSRIARLNTDGTLDTSFNVGTGANNIVNTTVIQSDGKIVIGGDFTTYNGASRSRIARLNTDGILDTSFNVGTGANNIVNTTSIQSDGQLIIGGDFTTYNGASRSRIARLNTDGTLDTSFNVGTGANWIVNTTAIQSDGQLIIGGSFTSYNGTSRNNIARLNNDGTLDNSFNNVGTGANARVTTTAIQPDGKIIIGGDFTIYNGTSRNKIARLNTDGTLDTSFNVGTGANNIVKTTSIQSDGKIIIGGDFTTYNGTILNRIARLNTDGTLDTSFNVGTGANWIVNTTAIQSDGKIIIGGDFTTYNGTSRNNIARLNNDGTLDTSFNVGIGANARVTTTAIQLDGKIIIGGDFTIYNGTSRNKIARLNTDGTLDTSFFNVGTGTGTSATVYATAVQSDGKIIIGGNFGGFNGINISTVARLNTDGTLDVTFPGAQDSSNVIYAISIQADGKIIIGGVIFIFSGTNINHIARLNADGTLDTSFNVGTGTDYTVYTTTIQPDGKIIIGGGFTSYNGTGRNRVARILNCGVTASYTSIDNGNGNYSFTNTSIGNFNQTHWAFGDGTTSTATNPNHTFSANGTYVVVLTVNDSTSSSCMDYYLDTIVVTGVVAPLQCAAGFVMYPEAGGVTVVNSSTGTNLTYLWDFGDGNTSNAQFPTHTYATTGNYYLCLTVDDGAGCVDMYCDSIGENGVVFNKQTGFTINVIAPPLATQVNEQAALTSGMNIYPNPTGNLLNVVLNEKEHYQLTIVTIDGKLLESKTIVGNTSLDVSKYPSGMYFIAATNNEGKVYQSKFVKE